MQPENDINKGKKEDIERKKEQERGKVVMKLYHLTLMN